MLTLKLKFLMLGLFLTSGLQSATATTANYDLSTTLPATVGVRYDGNLPNSANYRIVAPAGDVNGDDIDDFIVGDPMRGQNIGTAQGYNGGAFVVFGKVGDWSNTLLLENPQGFRIVSNSGLMLGSGVWPAGDFNGDGYDDVIVSSSGYTSFVVFGQPNPPATIDIDAFASDNTHGFRITNGGRNCCSAGDFNGDDLGDVLVSFRVPNPNIVNGYLESLCVVFGRETGITNLDMQTFSPSNFNGFRIGGADFSIMPSPAGDFNGDGFDDICIGGGSASKMIIFGKGAGHTDIDINVPNANWTATRFTNYCGSGQYNYQTPSDYNGDGLSDVLLHGECGAGLVVAIYGRQETTATIDALEISAANGNGFRITGKSGERAANMAGSAGDINGDGYDDILIQAPLASYNPPQPFTSPYSGSAYVIYGKSVATAVDINLGTVSFPGTHGVRIDGSGWNKAAPAFSNIGDVNDDGIDDVAYEEQQGPASSRPEGVNYILFGSAGAQSTVYDWTLY